MKKNIMKVALVAVVGLIAGINVFNAQKSDVLSDIAMANVEALADGTESSKGAANVLLTDEGLEYKCEDGRMMKIFKYSMDCFGEGNFPCSQGSYLSKEDIGPCYNA